MLKWTKGNGKCPTLTRAQIATEVESMKVKFHLQKKNHSLAIKLCREITYSQSQEIFQSCQ